MWGIYLTRLTGVGKPSHCGWRHSLSQNPALCRTERTSWAQHSLLSAPWLLVQRQAPPPWLPSRDGLCLQSGSLSRPFPPEDSSAGELYPLRHRGRVTWGESSNAKFQLGQEMHGTAHCDPERLFCLFNKGFPCFSWIVWTMSETLQKIPCPYFLWRSPNSWGFLSLAFLQTFPSLANSYLCFLSSPFLLFLFRKSHRELAVWESPLRGQRR